MPVVTHSYVHFQTPPGPPPGSPSAPTAVTSITKDAGATVSFLPGANNAGGTVTSWTVTPYIGGTAQTPQTIAAASATTLTGSNASVYTQVAVTGLTNGTAYTFTAHGTNSAGAGAESSASAANTPLAGLVFGDDFNGPAAGPIDPEWWLLDVAATPDEDDAYKPDHCYLDGTYLVLASTNDPYKGMRFTSGSIQNNTRNFFPTTGNTLTFETKAQVCRDISGGMWPCPWLAGTGFQQQFKTDQTMYQGDNNLYAEIDIAEWHSNGGPTQYQTNTYAGGSNIHDANFGYDTTAAQHVYRADYKPNSSVKFYNDGSLIWTNTSVLPIGAFFFQWFMEIEHNTTPSLPQYTYVDYVRIYDRNLG